MSAFVGESAPMGQKSVRRTRTRQELREIGFTARDIFIPAAAIVLAILSIAVIAWALSEAL